MRYEDLVYQVCFGLHLPSVCLLRMYNGVACVVMKEGASISALCMMLRK